MKTTLIIRSSVRSEQSASNKLADQIVARIENENHSNVIDRDVTVNTVPVLDATTLGSWFNTEENRTTEQQDRLNLSNALVEELKTADTIVIAAGMYNFTIPTQLKNYLDHVVRAGQTFQYTETGPKGLLSGKRAIIVMASGGIYSEGPYASADFLVPYLKQILAFIGITDVQVVRAEGQSLGGEAAATAFKKAEQEVQSLAL